MTREVLLPQPADYVEVRFEALRMGLVQDLSEQLMGVRCDIDQTSEFIRDRIKLQVSGFVWAEEESAKHQEIKYPRDWWQAFKARWFPLWALERWPAEYRKIVIDVKAIYPEFRPAMTDTPLVLRIMRKEEAG